MKSSKLIALLALLLCATASFAQTFLGSGNSADPFILKSTNEWEALAQQVAEGKNFQNQFFRLSADIDTKGIQVGTAETDSMTSVSANISLMRLAPRRSVN